MSIVLEFFCRISISLYQGHVCKLMLYACHDTEEDCKVRCSLLAEERLAWLSLLSTLCDHGYHVRSKEIVYMRQGIHRQWYGASKSLSVSNFDSQDYCYTPYVALFRTHLLLRYCIELMRMIAS